MKLNQAAIRTLGLPDGRTDAIYFDDDMPGLGLRLRAGGGRSWVFQYSIGKKQRRMSLGTAAAITLAAARKTAADLHARVRLGQDPAASRREGQRLAAETIGALLPPYLAQKDVSAIFKLDLERYLLRYAKPLHGLPIATAGRRDVASVLTAITAENGKVSANRLRAALSAFFSWAVTQGFTEANPVTGTAVAAETPRSRVLSADELATAWRLCGASGTYGAILRLLMLTGCRASEIGGLRWDEVRDDMIVLPAERTKNRRAHVVPLSRPAAEIIAARVRTGTHVFSCGPWENWSRAKALFEARMVAAGHALAPWVVHDLRRSVATGMAELGVQPHIIEAVLNHTSGHKAGVAGVYNRASYEREKRQALDMWGEHVMALVEGRATNVVPLRA